MDGSSCRLQAVRLDVAQTKSCTIRRAMGQRFVSGALSDAPANRARNHLGYLRFPQVGVGPISVSKIGETCKGTRIRI